MSCPNATGRQNGHCAGTGLIYLATTNPTLAGLPVPCPTCWQATGYDPLTPTEIQAMCWWTVAWQRLAVTNVQPTLYDDDPAADLYRWACSRLEGLSLGWTVTDRWHRWLQQRQAAA